MRTSTRRVRSVVLCAVVASGCGGGGETVALLGGVEKGPFVVGSSVDVSLLAADLSATGDVFHTQTIDDAGQFELTLTGAGHRPIEIEGNGFYYNEVTGSLSAAPITLRSITDYDPSGPNQAYVNIITHLAVQRVRTLVAASTTVDDAIAMAEAEIKTALHVGPTAFDPGSPGGEMTILGGDTDANAYLLAVSAVLAQAAVLRGGPVDSALQEIINTLSVDLAPDGTLTMARVDELIAAQRAVDPEAVMADLAARIAAIGSAAVVPDIDRILDTDQDGLVNVDDNCRVIENLDQADLDVDGVGDVCDTDAALVALVTTVGELGEPFSPEVLAYDLNLPLLDPDDLYLTAITEDPGAMVTIGGDPATSGVPFGPIPRDAGHMEIVVTAPDLTTTYVYSVEVIPGGNSAYLQASNAQAYDEFGTAVAISGNTIVVGALSESSNATGVDGDQADNSYPEAGAAYVFVHTGTGWVQQAYLKASNGGWGPPDVCVSCYQFGTSVAIDGDTIVVGARSETSNATGVNGDQNNGDSWYSGAAYVFVRDGSTWTQQAYLKASNTGVSDHFGHAVAISGDTIVVGAIGEDSNALGVGGDQSNNAAPGSGAAYVFTRSAGTWNQQAYLKATASSSAFGKHIAIDADVVAIGQGAAVDIFVRAAGTWSPQVRLTPSDPNAVGFGYSVSLSGDSLAVGAPEDTTGDDTGIVYVYRRDGTTWTEEAEIRASNADPGDQFGSSVTIEGDFLAAGAPGEDGSVDGSGAVYLMWRSGTTWNPQAYIKAPNPHTNDGLGRGSRSLGLAADALVVGAPGENPAGTLSGASIVFE